MADFILGIVLIVLALSCSVSSASDKLNVNPEDRFQFDMRQGDRFGSRQVKKQRRDARDFVIKSNDRPWFLMFNLFDPHVA